MWQWLIQNKEWIFSGIGVTVLSLASWLLTKIRSPKRASQVPVSNTVTQAPQVVINPTFNVSQHQNLEPAARIVPSTSTSTAARANLKVEGIKITKALCLDEGVWTLNGQQGKRYRGLLVDIANVPTATGNLKTVKLKASVTVGSRSYLPLPWLSEFTNTARLGPATRKTILLAISEDEQMAPWHFVLNHREQYSRSETPMDWTNMAPIPTHPAEILLVDVETGELVAKFEYIWEFDTHLGFPYLKTFSEFKTDRP